MPLWNFCQCLWQTHRQSCLNVCLPACNLATHKDLFPYSACLFLLIVQQKLFSLSWVTWWSKLNAEWIMRILCRKRVLIVQTILCRVVHPTFGLRVWCSDENYIDVLNIAFCMRWVTQQRRIGARLHLRDKLWNSHLCAKLESIINPVHLKA